MAETVDATPVYMRIRRRIEERIERGIYPTGSMIPSEKDLAEEFAPPSGTPSISSIRMV